MRKYAWSVAVLFLTGCGSITVPAAVKLGDGTVLTGTTTAAISGGRFEVSTPDQTLKCDGTYDALDTTPTITVPVTCSDGRYGQATVTRDPDGMGGRGFVETSDGQVGQVAFGNNAGSILSSTTPAASTTPPVFVSTSPPESSRPRYTRTYYRGPRGGCYYINSNGNKTYVDRSKCR